MGSSRFLLNSRLMFLPLFTMLCLIQSPAQFSNNPSFSSFGGLTKKQVTLQRRLPPVYSASGKTIDVVVENGGQLQADLLAAIQKQLTQADSSIKLGGTNVDLQVTCKTTSFTDPHVVQQNATGGSTEVINGQIGVAFNITEPGTKRVVKADLATSEVSEEVSRTATAAPAKKVFGVSVPATGPTKTAVKSRFTSTAQARVWMVEDVARKIASYLVNTEDTVQAQLASGGSLNEPDKLAMSSLWTRDLEQLETLTPYPDPRLDAYRVYNIGVANEALAYQATDVKSAIKYLEQASNDYGKALDAKPDEKGFLDPQNRIKTALAHYSQLGKTENAISVAEKATVASNPVPVDKGLSNQDVIDMVQSKIDSGNILDTIQHASEVSFDLSPKGQIQLTKGGVSGQLLVAMKQRERGTKVPTAKR
jgi:hypothetical protein